MYNMGNMMHTRLICWFSCGAASAAGTKMAINDKELLRGVDEVIIAYCKIKEEHPDNERFLLECQEWFGHPITILMHEGYDGSIYNVFDKNYMRTPAGSPCTRALKKQVRAKFQQEGDIHMFGYTVEEEERSNRFIDANNEILTHWPLIDGEITKADCLGMVKNAGIELPEMYKLGYEHNNCVGCVKGGMGYWNSIRVTHPEAFNKMAKFERKKGYTVLKEPKSKKSCSGQPLYLDTLDPKRGRMADEPKIECGIFCEIAEKDYNN
jgi:hypothetical protein